MLDSTKINYSLKKMVGKQHTWNSKQWFEEEDGLTIFQHANEVWIDPIDSTPPLTTNSTVRVVTGLVMTADTTVQGRKAFKAIDNSVQLRGFITPSYGINYTVNVFVNGTKIPTSHASQPLFDYANGVLSFEQTPPSGEITISAYQYVARSFSQYLDTENNNISKGILGMDTPENIYIIQHNMNSFDVMVSLFVYDDVDGSNYWKQDVVPMILLDENRIKIEMSEAHPIRFVIQASPAPSI